MKRNDFELKDLWFRYPIKSIKSGRIHIYIINTIVLCSHDDINEDKLSYLGIRR